MTYMDEVYAGTAERGPRSHSPVRQPPRETTREQGALGVLWSYLQVVLCFKRWWRLMSFSLIINRTVLYGPYYYGP